MNVELAKGVYWVGVVDWGLRHFHGHELSTHRGSTYNAYLILDEKIVLVDTVWDPFQEEFLENIRQVVDPAKIDIVVANHAEPDHSGALPAVMQLLPQGDGRRLPARGREHPRPLPPAVELPGRRDRRRGSRSAERELVFVEAPMLHWPDSMFTYLTGRDILMPNDAFGQHYATAFRFNDQVDQEELYEEALKYYANILTPFSDRVGPEDRRGAGAEPAGRHDRPQPRRHLAQGPAPDRHEVPGVGRPEGPAARRHPLRHDVEGHAPHGRGHRRRAGRRGRRLQAVPHGRLRPQRRHRRDLQGPGRSSSARPRSTTACCRPSARSWRTCGA